MKMSFLLGLVISALPLVCHAQPISQPPYDVSAQTATYPVMPGATAVSLGDDDLTPAIYPNLYMRLFGVNYTSFRIGSNGYILMGNQGSSTSPTPAHATDGPAISAFWGDLVPSAGGTVSWLAVGYNVLFVEWRNVPVRVGGNTTTYGVTVAIEINCVDLSIKCYYQAPTAGGFTALPTGVAGCVAISKPASATTYQTVPGYDAGYVGTDGSVTSFPDGRMILFGPNPYPLSPVQIVTSNPLPLGQHGVPYNTGLAAGGGIFPYSGWSSGGLPANWNLNPLGGSLTQAEIDAPDGADVFGGVYQVWIEVYDSQTLDLKSFLIPIEPPHGTEGQPYSYDMLASGGFSPHQWSISGQPTWLSMSATGLLSAATLPQAGSYSFDVTVRDNSANPWIYNGTMQLVVDPGPLAIATQPSLPSGTETIAYSQTFNATGGTPPYSWSATGLPTGWSLSGAGVLSAAGNAVVVGTYGFDVSVTDVDPAGATTVMLPCAVTINPLPPLVIQTQVLPDGTRGVAYAESISAVGGSGSGYVWTLTAGSLPPGLAGIPGVGTPSASLSGTPTDTGLYPFEVQVTDDVGNTATAALSILVAPPGINGGGKGTSGCAGTASAAAGWWWLVWFAAAAGAITARRRSA